MILKGSEIVKRAKSLSGVKYWYGGKGETATADLAKRLQKENPSVWTDSYYNKAIKDIGCKVGDCSYLVCYAYDISNISSYGIREKFSVWNKKPLNGMILWRKGHVAIYADGKALQLKGIDYDYVEKDYPVDAYTAVLYDPSVDYNSGNKEAKIGWHKDANGWYYRYCEGIGEGTYYKSGVYPCACKKGTMYFAFDNKGYMITDINKLYITDYGNIEYCGNLK